MRMTRDAYAREVWKAIEAIGEDGQQIYCPHENCEELLQIYMASLRAGMAVICPAHGVIYRE